MRPACLLSVCLVGSAPAFAGGRFTWERSTTGQSPVPITLTCEDGDARMETGGEKNRVLIWDAKKRVLTILDPVTKSYLSVDPEHLTGMIGRRPPKDEPAFKQTGKKSKVGPWECEHYVIRRSGQNGGVEIWYELGACLVSWAKSPVKAEELGCLKSMMGALDTLGAQEGDVTAGAVDELPGLPVRTVRDTGDGKVSVSTFKSFQRVPVGAEAFTVPADYAPRGSEVKLDRLPAAP
jgi:hypothetical protein